ncbi:YIP1 family protein [Pseudooceanicola sp.]|uniref:YIP1 family protein n=1 Tax=Pseudooceanicola sp. TaxID=1914328 RepID=UPI000C0A8777|nr:YIP1 family protein [Pseudooceanicola sp.]|tara:strand:- start:63727 stop:64212 length:486 start_codon:yes stop_codon:yes gene_type:complete
MSIVADIAATYRRPAAILRRRLQAGQREDRALAVLMAGCALLFVAQWPRLARQAFETGAELDMLLAGSLMALIFILPLLFYGLAALSHLIGRVLGGQGDHHSARMALFWALLAASPAFLLHGLTQGFVGPGPQAAVTGALALAVFAWFWLAGLIAVERGRA